MQIKNKVTFKVKSPRRLPDPIEGIDRHVWLVAATALPVGVQKDANPREQNTDKSVYKKVKQSLLNEDCSPNTFHLKNKGITILASHVEKIGSEDGHEVFEVHFHGDKHGIVDGGHTYDVIVSSQEEIHEHNSLIEQQQATEVAPINQFVKVEVLAGPSIDFYGVEIAGGLNTAVQVQDFSLFNLDGKFEVIKKSMEVKGYQEFVAFKQNQQKPYDVKEILGILDLFNIEDFPISSTSSKQPLRTCVGESSILKRFQEDPLVYERFKNIICDLLEFHDYVIKSTKQAYNQVGGNVRANWFKSSPKGRTFYFPLEEVKPAEIPFKGAVFPMIAAFRCLITLDRTGNYRLAVSQEQLFKFWDEIGPILTDHTRETYKQVGSPDAIAKSRAHWGNLLNTVRMFVHEKGISI